MTVYILIITDERCDDPTWVEGAYATQALAHAAIVSFSKRFCVTPDDRDATVFSVRNFIIDKVQPDA